MNDHHVLMQQPSLTFTCERDQTDQEPEQCLQADPHGQGERLHPPGGTVSCRLAAAHADGQSAGAGQSRGAAVRHHHGQEVLGSILPGERAPACHDAGRVV